MEEESSKTNNPESATQEISVRILSVTELVVEVVLMVTLSISPVVTTSSVFYSVEAAQSPEWLWVRDSVQSASAATDCLKI